MWTWLPANAGLRVLLALVFAWVLVCAAFLAWAAWAAWRTRPARPPRPGRRPAPPPLTPESVARILEGDPEPISNGYTYVSMNARLTGVLTAPTKQFPVIVNRHPVTVRTRRR